MRRLLLSVCVALIAADAAESQLPTRPSAADSAVFARARQLVATGNGAAGRMLVDSMLTVAVEDTPAYAEALYWRATLATTSADAERDFRVIIVDYPLSPRAGDALFHLAQLEMVRGDRQAASTHLDRFLLENPRHPERNRAGLSLVRLEFDQSEVQRGCIILGRALREVPQGDIELRNQLDYYSPRCIGVDTNRVVVAVDTVEKADVGKKAAKKETTKPAGKSAKVTTSKTGSATSKSGTTKPDVAPSTTSAKAEVPASKAGAKPDVAKEDSIVAPPPKPLGRYTLQVAAYSSRDLAEALVEKLKVRDLDARVVPGVNPTRYRVRIGRYATRAAATTAQAKIKATKIVNEVNVVEAGPDDQ